MRRFSGEHRGRHELLPYSIGDLNIHLTMVQTSLRPGIAEGGTNDESDAPSAPAIICHRPAKLDAEVRHWASISPPVPGMQVCNAYVVYRRISTSERRTVQEGKGQVSN